jgi:hypothetical protein
MGFQIVDCHASLTTRRNMFKRYLYINYRAFSALKFWLRRRITATGWLVLSATLAAAALGVDTNATLAYQTFTFLFFLVAVSAIIVRWSGSRRILVERILPKFGSAEEQFAYSVVLRNNSNQAQKSLHLFEDFADPRPTFDEFASTPEPGEEKRNWIDRTYNYYRWNWLLTKNVRARAEEHPLPDLPPKTEQNFRVALTPTRRGVLR